ncbi:MAG: UDP-3-O-[3-hydroxymyristoyl] glucosamine N-acyltransferase [Candidatus Omnitrophota bacterium]
MYTLASIADQLGLPFEGNGDIEILAAAGLREAVRTDISFLANKKYRAHAENTLAGVVIVPQDWQGVCSAALIRSPHPEADFEKVALQLAPPQVTPARGIHPSAVIMDGVVLGENPSIGPHAVIEAGAVIGANATIMAGSYIGGNVQIGDDCYLHPNSSVLYNSLIGHRFTLHSASVIGSDGFGYSVDAAGVRTKIPQIGIVEIGDDVEIGSGCSIDRARFGSTRIGNGVKMDNQVQIAHNVQVGNNVVIIAGVGISGSTVVGDRVILAGMAGIAGHLKIGEGAIVGGFAGVTKDIAAGSYVYGFPAIPFDKASKIRAHVSRLPQLKEHIEELEKRLQALEHKNKS